MSQPDIRPTVQDLARDLRADLAWVTSDEVCLTPRTVQVAGCGLRRAIAAESHAERLHQENIHLTTENAAFREILDELVALKLLKLSQGTTPDYLARHAPAWLRAAYAVRKVIPGVTSHENWEDTPKEDNSVAALEALMDARRGGTPPLEHPRPADPAPLPAEPSPLRRGECLWCGLVMEGPLPDVIAQARAHDLECPQHPFTSMVHLHAEAVASLNWWKQHAEALDRNWNRILDISLNAIRRAAELPDASVPELIVAIITERHARQHAEQTAAARASGDPAVRDLLLWKFGTTDPEILKEMVVDHRELFQRILKAARKVRDCWVRGDYRCWKDLVELFQALPEGFELPPTDTAVELKFCEQYIRSCHHPEVKYVSPQRRIEELEALLRELLACHDGHGDLFALVEKARDAVRGRPEPPST